uniref:Uncharacterized protein n=1 Tax=Laticauda laticaudata TaxID=8630 RepID=A0A8C5SJ40_LATLA
QTVSWQLARLSGVTASRAAHCPAPGCAQRGGGHARAGGAHPPFPSQRRLPRPEPFAKLAAAYGSSLAWRGGRWGVPRRCRASAEHVQSAWCHCAVGARSVGQKLARLLFPFGRQDWQGRYQQGPPWRPASTSTPPTLPPGGARTGSPPCLASWRDGGTGWVVRLTHLFLLASMIAGLLAGLLFGKTGYDMLLGWCCVTAFIRSLRLKILSEATKGVPRWDTKNQVRMYLTMAVAGLEPLLMYWLTFQLID